ncbi:hypothetical protein KIH27_14360 [Mycobacterium sp. M1]|uniref:Uncharacterized protein n=1 Tax=Mycolicibacter acidiphilus TaxID=2835306 RepID=A0ABS5RKF4_9MYCO|nr:hypothetical protein [Mycolicibacter acidiphilus]MBS9534772.1 hypothetical protein [Mycolicibacter acidiphilus]
MAAPNLSGYTAVNAAEYPAIIPAEWANAEAWSGSVFEAPGGQRCSLMSNSRGGWVEVNCWGTMPNGAQGIATAYNYTAGSFTERQGDLTGYNASLGEFHLLPAGSKITQRTADISATCAVDAAISCVAERQGEGGKPVRQHGFVLSEQGNSPF